MINCRRSGPAIEITRAELQFPVRHEGALDEADLLDRLTRIGLVSADRERALSAAIEAVAGYSSGR